MSTAQTQQAASTTAVVDQGSVSTVTQKQLGGMQVDQKDSAAKTAANLGSAPQEKAEAGQGTNSQK